MRLYFAGGGLEPEQFRAWGVKYKLYSYVNEKKSAQSWGENLMLDSGAFSVFTKGVSVDIDQLITFIKQYSPEQAIQLDVIGNEEQTWDNFLYMKRFTDVLPVISYGASRKHIERVLNSTSEYICLGGLVPYAKDKKTLMNWLNYIYSFPQVKSKKVHCLGITTKTILETYPFYSCDSSSWLCSRRYPASTPVMRFRQKTMHYSKISKFDIVEQLKLEKYITDLWEVRGIVWKN